MKRRDFLAFTLYLTILGCAKKRKGKRLQKGSKVLAFGDSMTFGYGASSQNSSYPAVLARLTGLDIVNGGKNGDTTSDGLARLTAMLDETKPELVLLCLGGNDFLQGLSVTKAKQNLIKMIEIIKSKNIEIVLIAVPKADMKALFGIVSDHPIYKEIAREMGVLLFENEWSKILSNSNYKVDPIHANDKGNEIFAIDFADFLRKSGFVG